MNTTLRLKSLSSITVIYMIFSIAFAFGYSYVYQAGVDAIKGEYIFFCMEVSLLVSFIYFIAARICLRKKFHILLVFTGPILLCILSVFTAFIVSAIIHKTQDQYVLRAYLIIICIFSSALVWLRAMASRTAERRNLVMQNNP